MDTQEALEFIRGKVAKYKIPKYVEFIQELPKTPSGKIQKNLLKIRNASSPSSRPSAGYETNQQRSM